MIFIEHNLKWWEFQPVHPWPLTPASHAIMWRSRVGGNICRNDMESRYQSTAVDGLRYRSSCINIIHRHFRTKDSSSTKKNQASSCFICYLFLFMLRIHLDRGEICGKKWESRAATGNVNYYYYHFLFLWLLAVYSIVSYTVLVLTSVLCEVAIIFFFFFFSGLLDTHQNMPLK